MPAEAFLKAEEAATQLLADLKQLGVEAQGYAKAKGGLDHAAASVERLAARAAELVGQLQRLAEVSERLGTTAILEKVDGVRSSSEAAARTSKQAADGQRAVIEALEGLRKEVGRAADAAVSEVRGAANAASGRSEAAAKLIGGLSEQVLAGHAQASRGLAEVRDATAAIQRESGTRLDAHSALLRSVRASQRWTLSLLVVTVLLLLAGLGAGTLIALGVFPLPGA